MTTAVHPVSEGSPQAGTPLKLLLAEDEPLQQMVLQRVLSSAGYQVHTAADGDQAFKRLQHEDFQILVTDWDMPGTDGAALCRRLRAVPREGYLYILMLTGHLATEDLVAALEAGADDYVRKPPEVPELLARLNAGRRIIELERSLKTAHERIERLSITDPLVDAFNRRYLDQKLPEEITRARRYERELSVVMTDIDHFKAVNDQHGHQGGDRVLRAFVQHLKAAIRHPVDWIARYGGEEFVLVLPETSMEAAAAVAEKIRAGCERQILPNCPCPITASFGVTALPKHDADCVYETQSLLGAADTALYRSKREGRNRVTLCDAPIR